MSSIPTRILGRTGLEVTLLGYGALELRGEPPGPEMSEQQVDRLLNNVLDQGINYIDTSIDYGRSQERIGRAISHRRQEYALASKCGCVPGAPRGTQHIHDAATVRRGVEHSLRALRTDYLDLVQFHRSLCPEQFDEHGALSELRAMRDEGKLRFIGVSAELPNVRSQIPMGIFDVFQIPYSAVQREHEDVISDVAAAGAGVVVRGGVARGIPEDWDGPHRYYMLPTGTMRDYWETAKLDELLDGLSRTEFLLRFVVSHSGVDTIIVGTHDADHLAANLRAVAAGPLSPDVLAEAKARLTAVGARSAKLSLKPSRLSLAGD